MANPKVALYLRLSREDESKDGESQSIANQRDFLTAYVKANGFEVAETFVDDGVSGTTFDRPGFQRMLSAIECGRIDTVITKDLSRLGRDYIQTGHFLERYFPEKGVRYIAVNDQIDSERPTGADMTPFLSIFNDLYAKDISKKVRTALDTKKRQGKFIGSTAPYGYQKDPADKNRLLPDPETAPVVQEIFSTYQTLASVLGVAKLLTEQGITPPNGTPGPWNDAMVRRILTNPTYTGDLTQNRARKINYKVRKVVSLPRSQWIIVPDTHEALISRSVFAQVQQLLKVRGYAGREKHQPRLLSGLVFCGDCGAPMTFQRQGDRRYLVCSASRRQGCLCTSHCIRECAVEQALGDALRAIAKTCPDTEAFVSRSLKTAGSSGTKKRLENELAAEKNALAALYRDKANGLIAEGEYLELREILQMERERLEALLGERLTQERRQKEPAAAVEAFLRFEHLERSVVLAFVERVVIHKDKSIDIIFRFRAPEAV